MAPARFRWRQHRLRSRERVGVTTRIEGGVLRDLLKRSEVDVVVALEGGVEQAVELVDARRQRRVLSGDPGLGRLEVGLLAFLSACAFARASARAACSAARTEAFWSAGLPQGGRLLPDSGCLSALPFTSLDRDLPL